MHLRSATKKAALDRAAEVAALPTKVFGIPELCEHILNYLPPKDLVLATGISHAFKDNIEASPKLKQKLFLQPRDESTVTKWLLATDLKPTRSGEGATQELYAERVVINPLLLERPKSNKEYWSFFSRTFKLLDPNKGDQPFAFKFQFKSISKAASCRQMHLTQPPQTSAAFVGFNNQDVILNGSPTWLRRGECEPRISNPLGLTLGDVLDAAEKSAWDYSSNYVELCLPGVFVVPQESE